ncbi:RIMS-binding protein 2 isoform X14 [Gouania willdenowi]|uniref:RIMS-binding protein 2 isoform X14 n=1 Tax=Gouania willdenowi TaxID=441366 RepID=UPI001056734E|nr:RIMS-binding protein 2 isoform X14 [Gouania willdenowi]
MRELVFKACAVSVWEKETEISTRRKEWEAIEAEVKKKHQTCQTLENESQDFLQENKHLSLQLFNNSHSTFEYEKVKSEYAQLKETIGAVTQERDLALWERNQLQGKLENLEQVLKHMREAAERRQQLELEHEQALAVLNAKQQEIDLLQKAQVEAKKEHEGAVHLLENHLDSMQSARKSSSLDKLTGERMDDQKDGQTVGQMKGWMAKVRELEEKCRSQSEQFNLLSKELEKFRLQAGKFDILSTESVTVCESPDSPNKSLSQLLNGLAAPIGKGNEAPTRRSLISEFIRPLKISGDKPELLSVKPTFLTRNRASSPARAFLSEMDKEHSSTTRSSTRLRFTGKVRLCIARYSYNPYDGPNEHPEAELPLVAGKYLYIYGTMDEDGFYEGELLDGQRGLVPSNFVDFLQDEETPSFQQRDTIGPPFPPQEVQVQCGHTPGVLQIKWKPPTLTPSGTSNGASVIGYAVCTKGQKIAEVLYPTADYVTVELNRIQCLEAREVIVRTLSTQGESQDSPVAVIPHNLLGSPHLSRRATATPQPMPQPHSVHSQTHPPYPSTYPLNHPQPHMQLLPQAQPHTLPHMQSTPHPPSHSPPHFQCHSMPKSKPFVSAREPETKEHEVGLRPAQPWERSPSPLPPMHGSTLEPPSFQPRRSPSPQRILPQPQGVPITNTIAKAMAREAAQRVFAEGNRVEKRNIFSERGNTLHPLNSDEEEDGYDSPHARRRGASVDEFLRGSELGRQHHHHHYGHSEEYYTESSRGSDLSDIMEEDEEDLYSEMQLEEGRRRSINSHSTLKAYYRRQDLAEERDCWDLQREVVKQKSLRSKRLHSIPEVAEEESDSVDSRGQRLSFEEGGRSGTPHTHRRYPQDVYMHSNLTPGKSSRLHRQRSSPRFTESRYFYNTDERGLARPNRQNTKSPDSGLDCGSEEEGSLGRGHRGYYAHGSPMRGPLRYIHCEGPVERRALAMGRKRTLTRQCSVEEEFSDPPLTTTKMVHTGDFRNREHFGPGLQTGLRNYSREGTLSEGRLNGLGRGRSSPHRDCRAQPFSKLNRDQLLIIGNAHGGADHLDHSGRRPVHVGSSSQRRPIPSIEITMDSNSEGSEGNLSPVKEDVYYGSVARRRIWRSMSSEDQYDSYSGRRHGREHRSSDFYEESEPEELTRVFVALFDYDPLSMSPNPDAADEELPFKEGQIIKVFGNKDTDGFYRAQVRERVGLIPCNMVSEIQTEDEEMMGQLLKQGYLPLNTPVEKLVNCDRFKDGRFLNRRSRKSKRERNKRSGHQYPMSTRRMVALYDYDPRESSPNVDVEFEGNRLNEEAELTFCAGDIVTVFDEIDEDGFYYGELNGHKGLVPSNFLEEVPDDVEVYLTDSPSRYPQDTPARMKTKRVPLEKSGRPSRAGSPTVCPHFGFSPATLRPGRAIRGSMDMCSSEKKKGLLFRGKKILESLGAVK